MAAHIRSDDPGRGSPGPTADRPSGSENARKPASPSEITKPSWGYLLKRSIREFMRDQSTTLAAALTYYAVLAIFPALLALFSLIGLFGQTGDTTKLILQVITDVGSESVAETVRTPIMQLAQAPGAGLALVIGLLGAIWSASGYVNAFSHATNRVFRVEEGRPFWKLRPVMLLLTVILLVIAVIIALLLVVSGPIAKALGDAIGLGDTALLVWNIAKWPVIAVLAVVIVAVLYYGTPNVIQPKFRWMTLGALIALVVMALATAGFFFYVSNFANYQKTYGSVAGVIIMLLWLWIMNLSLIFGVEFDSELERSRQLLGGIAAEHKVQLPLRDDKQIEKNHAKEQDDVDRGRALRRSGGETAKRP